MPKKKVVHLTVFLIKDQFNKASEILETDECDEPVEVAIAGHGKGRLFIKQSPNQPPKWASLFAGQLDARRLKTANVAAAFLFKVDDRWYVLTFGQGGRFLLKGEVFEERFGLLTALNSVNRESFRAVDMQSLDAIESHSRIQSGQGTSADQFGLDIEQDLLKAIVGAPDDEALGSRMAGADSLSVAVRMTLADLPTLLAAYRTKFEAGLSNSDYQWVNNLSMLKTSSALIPALEALLVKNFSTKNYEDVWLSIPEVIDWTMVVGFMFTGGKGSIHPDISLGGFLSTIPDGVEVSIDLLKSRRVYCADQDHNRVYKSWSVYKCLYAETTYKGNRYVLNDGKWFNVSPDFVKRTNEQFSKANRSKLLLPLYQGNGEGKYNASVANSEPDQYQLLDAHLVRHGGGAGKVEVCDLLSRAGHLLHVKLYGKSSVLSHLFAQGFVSGQLIQTDGDFRAKVANMLKGPFDGLIRAAERPKDQELTIVFAVISESPGDELRLPFFSRVNFNNTAKALMGYGFRVELLKVAVDPNYAKKVVLAPA